jgi:hypothetical protein
MKTTNVTHKKKSHPIADQFSDDEMDQIKRYGQALGGGVTPFDEEVERHLPGYEALYAKLRGRQQRIRHGAGLQRNRRGCR